MSLKLCVSCGEPTEWRCSDCAIGKWTASHPPVRERAEVPVCHHPRCRNAHEKAAQCSPSPPLVEIETQGYCLCGSGKSVDACNPCPGLTGRQR